MRIVFFGTSSIGSGILRKLHENHEVALVVTSPDAKIGRKRILTSSAIAQTAESLGLRVAKPETVKQNPKLIRELTELNADIFIVVSYGKILPEEVINIPPLKTVNVHFSLLPKYRGAAPVQYALLNGENITGTTIFILDKGLDTGPILSQQNLSIKPDETNPDLQLRLGELSADLLIQTLKDYSAGKLKPKNQDDNQATFAPIIKREAGRVDWNQKAEQIYNQWRALQPWPGICTYWEGQLLKILLCKPAQIPEFSNQPGTTKNQYIQCGNGSVLELIQVQLAGKKPAMMADFLNGYPSFNNSKLE